MKKLTMLAFFGMYFTTTAFASDLVWDDVKTVPAIKIESDKYLSCKKTSSLNKKGSGQVVPTDYYEKEYFCLNKENKPEKVVYLTTQELATEYLCNVKALGVMEHKIDNKPGQYTLENVYVDLYYKNK